MREQGLVAAQPRRKVRTTIPAADLGSRPDLVKRDSRRRQARDEVGGRHPPVSEPGRDPICLATVPGCCTKKVVGYAMADNMRTDLICEAIDMAARRCPTRRGKTIFHPRPRQPVHLRAARQAPERLRHSSFGGQDRGVLGGCLGGVVQCDPQGTKEPTPMVYPTRRKAINDIASWIELIYNQTRLHSALGYRTQGEAEHDLVSSNKAA